MDTQPISYLPKFWRHLRNGTLGERLLDEWRSYDSSRRENRWRTIVRNGQTMDTRLQQGIRMRLYSDSILCHEIYCRDFEAGQRKFVNHFLRPGDIFVDAGANIGLFTLIAAKRVGRRGKVFAFEPSTLAYQRLQANVRLNHLENVSCLQMALSDTADDQRLSISLDGFDAWNSLARPSAGALFATESVKAITFDNFVQQKGIEGRVSMMKIDVEGWEYRVLQGGRETFAREDAPILQVEFTEQNAMGAGSSCAKLYRYLEELGYEMFIFDEKSRRLVHDPLRKSYPYLNLIALKNLAYVQARVDSRSSLLPSWSLCGK